MQPRKPARVLGPYQEGSKWRVNFVGPQGRRSYILRSQQAAHELLRRLMHSLSTQKPRSTLTLAVALHLYQSHMRKQRSRQRAAHTMGVLRRFLPKPFAPLTAMSPATARRLARFEHPSTRRLRRSYAASTRRAILGHVRRFYEWALQQGHISLNPFAGIRPMQGVGTASRRLYCDEIPRFTATCLSAAESGDLAALGALLIGLLRLQSRHVLSLRIQDVDRTGLRVHIADGRGAGWRSLPPELRPAVVRAIGLRSPEEYLLGPGRTGRVRPRNFLWRTVQRLCLTARVSPTCPRALRRLSDTLANPTPRPSRRVIVRFARSHRLHTPAVVRWHSSSFDTRDIDQADTSDPNQRMAGLVERMQSLLTAHTRRGSS